ncbi:hypothetical protein [Gordonia sputi]
MTLARRLQLDVPNVKLGTLAGYWGSASAPRTMRATTSALSQRFSAAV